MRDRKKELQLLEWFLARHPDLFPGVTGKLGTDDEDFAGKDAWLSKAGIEPISIGLRLHAKSEPRSITLRVQERNVPVEKFEYAKLCAGGGPRFYLQAWGYLPDHVDEYVFFSVERMRSADCFNLTRKDEFWTEYYYKKTRTRWVQMDVGKLHQLHRCVILSHVYSRDSYNDPVLDKDIYGDERQVFDLKWESKKAQDVPEGQDDTASAEP